MRKAVRELIEVSDRREDCSGPEACPVFRKKGYCPDYCPSQPPEGIDPYCIVRYYKACETLLLIERLGLSYNDLDWHEIPDLLIVITEMTAYENRRLKEKTIAGKH